jgi:hypothetical protein
MPADDDGAASGMGVPDDEGFEEGGGGEKVGEATRGALGDGNAGFLVAVEGFLRFRLCRRD